ncbi:MAG: hypothetical protein LC111_02100 [Bacteroidia bacterium]|nr:hypothetical protein [Bacteroidia bacterium]
MNQKFEQNDKVKALNGTQIMTVIEYERENVFNQITRKFELESYSKSPIYCEWKEDNQTKCARYYEHELEIVEKNKNY